MKIIEVTLGQAIALGKKLNLPYFKEALFEAQIEAKNSGVGYILNFLAEDVLSVVYTPNTGVRYFTDNSQL